MCLAIRTCKTVKVCRAFYEGYGNIPEGKMRAVARRESTQDGKHEEVMFPKLLIAISLHRRT